MGPVVQPSRRCFRPALFRSLVAVCAWLCVPATGTAAERMVDLELVLAVDVSGSIDIEEAALQRRGYVQALQHPDVVSVIEQGELELVRGRQRNRGIVRRHPLPVRAQLFTKTSGEGGEMDSCALPFHEPGRPLVRRVQFWPPSVER